VLETDDSADPVEREAEAELDRCELGVDEEQQRPAAVRNVGRENADRLDRHRPHRELENPRVFRAFLVDAEEAPTLDDAGVHAQPDAVGRPEPRAQIGGSEVPAAIGHREGGRSADPVDRDPEGPEAGGEASGRLELESRG
jgi:hypothetical protein